MTFRVRSPGEPEGFNIELVFQDTVTQAQEALFRYAAGRWMSVFTAGLPDQETSSGEQVDDLRINVYVENIDTFLGQGWQNELRETSLLPITGGLTIDLPHLEKTKAVLPTILHEMGHVLGIGTLWTRLGFLQNPSFLTRELTRTSTAPWRLKRLMPREEGTTRVGRCRWRMRGRVVTLTGENPCSMANLWITAVEKT